jgi:hypothetical protein
MQFQLFALERKSDHSANGSIGLPLTINFVPDSDCRSGIMPQESRRGLVIVKSDAPSMLDDVVIQLEVS